ncbi:hypothetical protein CEE37_13270 [candidate division LCP-89 bacterium B3_LCP]|uniref:HTH tetR-type domain-containing protein n=1 Tax=candidate division LCP-89 bacterium B3_LCP TaxID=2012998 RepID=A0A532USL7_UNCL8|nr:MAG: hypothetical protein CEE37_13270 [candidate division LCP-89 bacterium B3_LCP]
MNERSFNKNMRTMSPKSKEQFDQIRAQSRQTIMEAALELFTHRGYHGTSVSMIANQAGVSTGLMYNYFQSKVELLEAIVRQGMSIIESLLGDVLQVDDPRDRITTMVEMTFQIAERDIKFWSLYFSVLMQPDLPGDVQRIFSDFLQNTLNLFEDLFSQLGYSNPQAEARILAAILDGALLHYWIVGKDYPIENVKQTIIDKYCGTKEP